MTDPAPDLRDFHQGEICIFLTTRARPQFLADVFASLRDTTARKEKVRMWLYIDEDDEITARARRESVLPDPGFPVNWYIGPQTASLGATHVALWDVCGHASEIYVTAVDDARFDTPAWDEVVRSKFGEYPDGLLLAFPHDPMTADQATYPIYSRRWWMALGGIYPGYFPYWFDDKWVDQVARLAGRCAKIPIVLSPVRGKGRTKRMRNLPFWTRFYQLTQPERVAAARKLVAAMYSEDEAKLAVAVNDLERRALESQKEIDSFSDLYCVFQEERHTELTPEERQLFDAKYFRQEAIAVAHLIDRALELTGQKLHAEALDLLAAVQLSDLRVRQAQALTVECLRAVGRSGDAERVARDVSAAWPQFRFLRRLFRFLGMVANDGKRMLVGLTQKGKQSG